MRISGNSKNILPLLEIILAFLFLAISCVVLLQMFIISRSNGQLARDITNASLRAQSVMEHIKSADNSAELEDILSSLFKNSRELEYALRYDSEWTEVSDGGEYILSLKLTEDNKASGVLYNINISVDKVNPYPLLKGVEKQKLTDFQSAKYISKVSES